jgi:hypothetical protein
MAEEQEIRTKMAHDTGRLDWGTWVDDCAGCRAVLQANRAVLLVIKGSASRAIVTAGQVADAGADELLEEGYVREVFVAQEQAVRP